MALDSLFQREQFTVPQAEKESLLLDSLNELSAHHQRRCEAYRRITAALHEPPYSDLSDLPALPVSLFKTHQLKSINDDEVFKIMTSSATTGQAASRVYLDRETAGLQSRALAAIMTRVLGSRRMPMLIVDTPNVVRDRASLSARGAGVLGMMPFGRNHTYVLNDDTLLDTDSLKRFLSTYNGEPILIFGFTFMLWKYFLQPIRELDLEVDLSNAVLIHSGGWKKLVDEAVGNAEFREAFRSSTGLTRIHNFYGMVEQVGSVFVEHDDGFLYPPNFADVIIRDPVTWAPAPHGTPGVVEVLSALPRSYPGHALLTEDLGIVDGVSDGSNGWSGKRLKILGRVPRFELRGCSDTHAYDRSG